MKAAINLEMERQRILDGLPDAIRTLLALTQHADQDSVRLRASEAVMDRTLGRVTDKLKVSGDASEPLEIVISRPAPSLESDT